MLAVRQAWQLSGCLRDPPRGRSERKRKPRLLRAAKRPAYADESQPSAQSRCANRLSPCRTRPAMRSFSELEGINLVIAGDVEAVFRREDRLKMMQAAHGSSRSGKDHLPVQRIETV